MIYVLGLLLLVYFGWRFGGLFRAWRDAGFPARPEAARNVRFYVGVILLAFLISFFLWMAPEVTAGLVLWMLFAAAFVLGMQFIRENLALVQMENVRGRGSAAPGDEEEPPSAPRA